VTSQLVLYKAILAYDGTNFAGFQRQANARTIQGEVEAALRKIGWQQDAILAAGRTDTGVHAAGQVITFALAWAHTVRELLNALNAYLPPEIAFQQVEVAHEPFHPRYDALSRRYRYTLFSQATRNPLRERFAWRIWLKADFELLTQAAALFVGTYDFRAFGTPPRPGGSTTRTVFASQWEQHSASRFSYEIEANAFLYHMVRRIVRFQVDVATGKLPVESISLSLTGPPQDPVIGLAPAHGLTLLAVRYPEK